MKSIIESNESHLPSGNELITCLIRKRRSIVEQEELILPSHHELPELKMTQSLTTLFGTPELWVTVDERYIADSVVRSLLFRQDGKEIDEGVFTSMLARRKDKIEERYGVRLRTVWKQQHHQYWNEDFVRAFFATLQEDLQTPWGFKQKSIYEIRETVDNKELLDIAATVQENVKYMIIRSSDIPFYRDILLQYFGITRQKRGGRNDKIIDYY